MARRRGEPGDPTTHPEPAETSERISPPIASHGLAEAQGPRSTMEDAAIITSLNNGEIALFGVYDGHGGSRAAELAQARLHHELNQRLQVGLSVEQAFIEAYITVDEQIQQETDAGATAVNAFIRGNELVIANAGDAQVVLARGGQAQVLTKEHKVTDPDEEARLQQAGATIGAGRVWSGQVGMAVARALGDRDFNSIIAEPAIQRETLTEEDTDLIIACDGLWDVVTPQEAIEITRQHNNAADAAEALKQEALNRGTGDNVTVEVVKFDIEQIRANEAEPPRPPRPRPTQVETQPADTGQPTRGVEVDAEERAIRQRILEGFEQVHVGSAEVMGAQIGAEIRLPSNQRKRAWAEVFNQRIHDKVVAERQRELLGQLPPGESIEDQFSEEEIIYAYLADPRRIQSEQDLLRLSVALKNLQRELILKNDSSFLFATADFEDRSEGKTQKNRDLALLKYIRTEVSDPALRGQLEQLFWVKMDVDAHLRGENDELIEARRQEFKFETREKPPEDWRNFFRRILYEREGWNVPTTPEYELAIESLSAADRRETLRQILTEDLEELAETAEGRAATVPSRGAETSPETESAERETRNAEEVIAEVLDTLATPEGQAALIRLLQETMQEAGVGLEDETAIAEAMQRAGISKSEKYVKFMAGRVKELAGGAVQAGEVSSQTILAALWFLLSIIAASLQPSRR